MITKACIVSTNARTLRPVTEAKNNSVAIVDRVCGANGLAIVIRHIAARVRWSALGALGVHALDLPTRGAARRAALEIAGGSTSRSPSMLDRGGDR